MIRRNIYGENPICGYDLANVPEERFVMVTRIRHSVGTGVEIHPGTGSSILKAN